MRENAIRIRDIVSVDLSEVNNFAVSHGVSRKHYFIVRFTDKDNRSYSFVVQNEKCQREAYDYMINNIIRRAEA